jgi:hypothetical protein
VGSFAAWDIQEGKLEQLFEGAVKSLDQETARTVHFSSRDREDMHISRTVGANKDPKWIRLPLGSM